MSAINPASSKPVDGIHCEPARFEFQLPKLFRWWNIQRTRRASRRALKELSSLDDSMLKDIGISRADVDWASQLPKSVDASVELEIIARRRSAR